MSVLSFFGPSLGLAVMALASYEMARSLTKDDGPMDAFVYPRTKLTEWAEARDKGRAQGSWPRWRWLAVGLNCPYCISLWTGLALWWLPWPVAAIAAGKGLVRWLLLAETALATLTARRSALEAHSSPGTVHDGKACANCDTVEDAKLAAQRRAAATPKPLRPAAGQTLPPTVTLSGRGFSADVVVERPAGGDA